MSQLNNTNEETNFENIENTNNPDNINSDISKKKKMKTSTKIIIFLIVFLIISISFTIWAIYYTNNHKEIVQIQTSTPIQIENDGLGIKSLTQQYNENDLNIIDITDNKGHRTPKHDWDSNYSKVNIEYFKIDGLKNTNIENQINKEIKALVYSFYSDSELKDSKIDYIQIRAYEVANFANTLSVIVNKTIFYTDENSEITENYHYLNYNLVNGEKIKFSELFTNASLKNALMQGIYDDIISEYINLDNSEGLIDMSKADLSTVEEETYIILNKLMKNINNINFYYTPSDIYIKDYNLSISMSNIYSSISIYNRFITSESIFDGTYEGNKNIFVFSSRSSSEDIQYSRYEDIYDNFRVEISIEMNNDLLSNTVAKQHLNDTIKKVKDEISKIQKQAKNNTKKAFVYTAYYSMYNWESYELSDLNIENDVLSIWGESYVYTMSKDYYTNTFIAEIAAFHNGEERVEYWPVFTYYIEDNKNVEKKELSTTSKSIDLFTNKEPDQIIGEYYINQHKANLEDLLNSLTNNIDCGDAESQLTYIKDCIVDIQKEYNFTNNDIKDVLTLIEKIENTIEKNKNTLTMNSVDIVTNTISVENKNISKNTIS